jgi:hypothetical protein
LHVQLRNPATDLSACFGVLHTRGFTGSAAIEFTRGIGPAEQIETLYANARADLAYCREHLP